jgi:hypothetical protein
MFQHVTVLVSFVFAIALTHVFSSASQLLLARDRVRFSALLADVGWIRVDSLVDPLRNAPRFKALAEKIVPVIAFKGATASK